MDIEQVFESLSEELDGNVLAIAKGYFLQGYQSEKTLDSDYEQRLPLMRRFCNLYAYARLIRCMAEILPEEPEWMGMLRGRLEMKRKYLESIIEKTNV